MLLQNENTRRQKKRIVVETLKTFPEPRGIALKTLFLSIVFPPVRILSHSLLNPSHEHFPSLIFHRQVVHWLLLANPLRLLYILFCVVIINIIYRS